MAWATWPARGLSTGLGEGRAPGLGALDDRSSGRCIEMLLPRVSPYCNVVAFAIMARERNVSERLERQCARSPAGEAVGAAGRRGGGRWCDGETARRRDGEAAGRGEARRRAVVASAVAGVLRSGLEFGPLHQQLVPGDDHVRDPVLHGPGVPGAHAAERAGAGRSVVELRGVRRGQGAGGRRAGAFAGGRARALRSQPAGAGHGRQLQQVRGRGGDRAGHGAARGRRAGRALRQHHAGGGGAASAGGGAVLPGAAGAATARARGARRAARRSGPGGLRS